MSEFEKLSLVKLRDLCKSLGLKATGKKSILVSRLLKVNSPQSPKVIVPDDCIVENDFEIPTGYEIPLSLNSVSSNWFGRHVLCDANVKNSTLGIKESSAISDATIQGSIRFWMSRFYNLIEFNEDDWKEFEINQIMALSSDFIVAEESSQSVIRLHLVLQETGQVVDSTDPLCNSKLSDWKVWTAQFKGNSLISSVETCDSDYPNNISKRILQDSKEYKIAARFTLVHSKGLCGGSDCLVQMKKNSSEPMKCLISVPFDNAVVSVSFSWKGISFVLQEKY